MTKESFVMGVAGLLLGLLAGGVIFSQSPRSQPVAAEQQTASSAATPSSATPSSATPSSATGQNPAPPIDENRISQLKAEAERDPRNAAPRVQLGNLYFDSERFDEAARWYVAALEINPRDADVSTDLGIAYYYTNQPDKALAQFDKSLVIDPKHSKTLLNIGVVRAWGKQDLEGAAKAWERVIEVAPGSEEAARARQGLEGIRAAHPDAGRGGAAKPPGRSE